MNFGLGSISIHFINEVPIPIYVLIKTLRYFYETKINIFKKELIIYRE